jgi:hypothetical protein
MPFLTDAEIVLGLSRHLGTYAACPPKAALAQLEFAGHVLEIAWRLRGSGLSSAERARAIAIEAGVATRALEREILPTLAAIGWLDLRVGNDGVLFAVDERIPPPAEIVARAEAVLDAVLPTAVELAALELLRETTRQPLLEDAALELAAGGESEPIARDAIRHLVAINLVKRVQCDDGRRVLFNPHIWVGDPEVTAAALRVEDAKVRSEIGALIEEIASNPGMPQDHVDSTEQRWIDFAVTLGLVQRSLVVTSEGNERGFLFTPHLARDPFGVAHGDPSGHVRQLVGSMIYAATFAKYRLHNPAQFVGRLIRDGEAGDASPIGTDYPMLETAGIVRVEPSYRHYKLVLLQEDVAEDALRFLSGRQDDDPSGAGLRAQRSYVHIERERARLALETPGDDADTRRIISALRDTAARRTFRAP